MNQYMDSKDIDFLKELCRWLAMNHGMIPKDYARELAKIISVIEKKDIEMSQSNRLMG